MPGILHLDHEAVLVLLSALLDLLAGGAQVVGQLGGVPAVVGLDDIVLPILLDKIGEILAVGRSRVGDVVVGKPALKLSLMPLVVSCSASPSVRMCFNAERHDEEQHGHEASGNHEHLHRPRSLCESRLTSFAQPVSGDGLSSQGNGGQRGQGELHGDNTAVC